VHASLPAPELLARMRRLRWISFALVSGAYVLSFFHRIAPNAIAGELRSSFHASGAELGALAGSYFWLYAPMQVPTGVLVDALGPRRIVALGGAVAGIGSILFGRAETLVEASAGRALVGLGVSVAFVSLLKLVTAWFRDSEFGTISGLVMVIGNLGAISSATPLAWLVGVTSWRNVFVAVGVSSLAGAVLTWLLVRDRPREAGLPSMRELDGRLDHAPNVGRWWEGLWVVVRNPATWPGFFVNLGLAGAYLSFAGLWAGPYLMQVHGMTRARAARRTRRCCSSRSPSRRSSSAGSPTGSAAGVPPRSRSGSSTSCAGSRSSPRHRCRPRLASRCSPSWARRRPPSRSRGRA